MCSHSLKTYFNMGNKPPEPADKTGVKTIFIFKTACPV